MAAAAAEAAGKLPRAAGTRGVRKTPEKEQLVHCHFDLRKTPEEKMIVRDRYQLHLCSLWRFKCNLTFLPQRYLHKRECV